MEASFKNICLIENKLMVTKGEAGREKLGVWDWQIHTILYKIDRQQGFTV